MERVRNYNLADLSRATHSLNKEKKSQWWKGAVYVTKQSQEISDNNQRNAIEIANSMYQTHKKWTDEKMQPLIAYLQRDTPPEQQIKTKESVIRHYRKGLSTTIDLLSRTTKHNFDLQDAVVSYTANFTKILRTCERFDISSKSALVLAEHAYNINPQKLDQLFKKHTDIPDHVIERGVQATYSERFMERYCDTRDEIKKLATNKRYQHLPKDVLISASMYSGNTEMNLERYLDPTPPLPTKNFYEVRGPHITKIEGVPHLTQRHRNWCGYTSLAMVLQHFGYTDLTPEKIFEHINGEYDGILEYLDPSPGPSINTLGRAAKELTSLNVILWNEEKYKKLREKKPNATPHHLLKAYILKEKAPCIVRIPGHFKVATGVDTKHNMYVFNDPLLANTEALSDEEQFERIWSEKDRNYNHMEDSRHLFLAIYPQKK